jgi:nucleoside-diphosphate-sugar epimerase
MAELTLVTGASGFIGNRLLGYLRALGWETVGWTRAFGDLRDASAVQSTLADLKPSRIVHLAAGSADAGEVSWTRVADEQRMLANLVYGMQTHCQLIYTGSVAEYGRAGTFDELDHCAPDTAYGCAKYSCTTLALALRAMLGRDIRVARLFGVYGAGEKATRLLPGLLRKLVKGEPVPLSDGLQVRDFIHVDDASRALVALACADEAHAIVNIGTGIGLSVREVCEVAATALGVDHSLLRFGELPRRAVDKDCLVARIERLGAIMAPPVQRWTVPALAAECVAEFVVNEGLAAQAVLL